MLFKILRYHSSLPIAECLERVERITDQWWLAPGTDPVIGKVWENGFRWHMRPSPGGNPPGPILHVSLQRATQGTEVSIWVRPGIFQILIFGLVFGFFGFYSFIILRENWPLIMGGSPLHVFLALPMIAMTCVIPTIAIRQWRRNRAGLMALLHQTLEIDRI